MIEVAVSIIPEDFEELRAETARVRDIVRLIQIDISDGTFTPTMTWPFQNGADFYQKIITKEEGLPFWEEVQYEVDMLIDKPEEHIDDWIETGVSKIIIHLETTNRVKEIWKMTSERGVALGLSINPSTDDKILYDNLKYADFTQFMGNDKIGFHAVLLDENILPKIKNLREENPDMTIAVDIGVNTETARKLVQSGVNKLVSGSAILNSEDPKKVVDFFKFLDVSH